MNIDALPAKAPLAVKAGESSASSSASPTPKLRKITTKASRTSGKQTKKMDTKASRPSTKSIKTPAKEVADEDCLSNDSSSSDNDD
jgi:hypothetical protein